MTPWLLLLSLVSNVSISILCLGWIQVAGNWQYVATPPGAGGLLVQTKDGPKNNSRRHVVFYIVLRSFGLFLSNHCDSAEVSLLLVHCAHSWRVSSISILVLVTNGPRWVAFLPCRSQQVFSNGCNRCGLEVPRQSCCLFGSTLHGSMPKPLRSELLGKCRLVICERLFLSYFYGEQGGVGRKRWQIDLCWQFLSIENCN